MAKLMFSSMKGNAERWGSEMAAHMPSLKTLAKHWSFGQVIELGVGQGYSTLALSSGLYGSGKKLISYDLHVSVREKFIDLLSENKELGVEAFWEFRQKDSVKASEDIEDGTVSLLFIDTGHQYEPTVRELYAWEPKMMPGGVICGHDYYLEKMGDTICGVGPAVDQFVANRYEKYHLQVLPHDQGLFIIWPKK